MVRNGHADYSEHRRNQNTTATTAAAVATFLVAGVRAEPNRGRKLVPFRPQTVMIRERTANHKPLHNFSLPRFRWGNQIPMRCMKAVDHSVLASSSSSSISVDRLRLVQQSFHRTSFAASPEAEEEEDSEGIEAIREKLMLDLKKETDKIRKELLKDEEKEDDDDRVAAAAAAAEEGKFGGGLRDVEAATRSKKDEASETRPWNLRTRRAACRAPAAKNDSPVNKKDGVTGKEKASLPVKEKEREKFALGLKRKEIEEDFMILTGHRPPRRPKKRPRAVRKLLDMVFPGMWLTEVTADAYKVVEVPDDG